MDSHFINKSGPNGIDQMSLRNSNPNLQVKESTVRKAGCHRPHGDEKARNQEKLGLMAKTLPSVPISRQIGKGSEASDAGVRGSEGLSFLMRAGLRALPKFGGRQGTICALKCRSSQYKTRPAEALKGRPGGCPGPAGPGRGAEIQARFRGMSYLLPCDTAKGR